jgi:hypothetical protein
MALGHGKYDAECTNVREHTQAAAVALIVVGGDRGHGFSVQAPEELMVVLPDLLERMARDIRDSLKQ